ncbi:MAG: flippase-like domain-containing protein [Lachnospiraceae bacterium]|nr:flippase-like domain-containing protein [Lachnospiraceae bacterium]
MSVFLFIISIILIIAGHMVKSLRQKQFADFYEDVKLPVFNEALAAGYILNLAVPFRLGDLLRAVILGRRMKNGFSFAFATVVVDRILDVIVVGFIYLILYFLSPAVSLDAGQSALFYVLLSAVSIALIAIVTCARVKVKKIIRLFTGIFNEKIELTLMFFFWSVITAFRDIAIRSNKKKLILLTTLMWGLYTASYYVIALSITMMGGEATLMGVFSYLFSSSSIDKGNLSGGYTDKVMIVYLALSATLLFVIGVISSVKNRGGEQDIASEKTMMLLPQVHESDRRSFLENYFEGDRHAYVRGYLEANNDIQIISDYSAGSNATTLLAIKDDRTIFRKYVVGADAGKLHDQVEWIQGFCSVLPLPEIIFEKRDEGMTLYDMPAVTGASGFFEFIHTNPVEKSFKIIRHVFDDLDNNLYSREEGTADPDIIEKYIEKKILKNIKLIEENHRFADLIRYEEVVVNGKTVKGFPSLKKAMSKEKLKEIFSSDRVSPIHGDVTVENIIVTPGADKGRGYYLIDPNTGNILDSRFIDYAKLLQSLHGGYEFLMRTERCSISGNEIKFMAGASRSYRDLYKEYSSMLKERFSESELKSIYYHEIANWLRLMPYKLEHDEAKAPVFLAGMLLVADGII